MKRITPFLWLDGRAEAAAEFYTSVFGNSKINNVTRYGEGGPAEPGSVMTVAFELDGQEIIALNGGPVYSLTPAFSLVVGCDTQDEIDYYWEKLSDGGQKLQCGWLTDKFGVTWQVVPAHIGHLVAADDPKRAKRVMDALMPMVRIDMAALQRAYDGK